VSFYAFLSHALQHANFWIVDVDVVVVDSVVAVAAVVVAVVDSIVEDVEVAVVELVVDVAALPTVGALVISKARSRLFKKVVNTPHTTSSEVMC
jgi:hypothetical protein